MVEYLMDCIISYIEYTTIIREIFIIIGFIIGVFIEYSNPSETPIQNVLNMSLKLFIFISILPIIIIIMIIYNIYKYMNYKMCK